MLKTLLVAGNLFAGWCFQEVIVTHHPDGTKSRQLGKTHRTLAQCQRAAGMAITPIHDIPVEVRACNPVMCFFDRKGKG